MNVLMINGSPRVNGNTAIALREMEQIFKLEASTASVCRSACRMCADALPAAAVQEGKMCV